MTHDDDAGFDVPFSYLERQFDEPQPYLDEVRKIVQEGAFTLGEPVERFEQGFADHTGAPHAVGVGTGTDALRMTLEMLGVGPGDEVITTPMTFVATVGAIVATGARPVFVDSQEGFVIDQEQIEGAITEDTAALLPVHYTGNMPDMDAISDIAEDNDLPIVEDACQAIGATFNGKHPGEWSAAAGYSLHPLKNLNVWGDGGVIVTHKRELAEELRLYRNHGLRDRDTVERWGINCRLDALQAAIGLRLLEELPWITKRRQAIAQRYDSAFEDLGPEVEVPTRDDRVEHVFHLYILRAEDRDGLLEHLHEFGVEAKIHYPVPLHLQPAADHLGYERGDFPRCETDCERIITLPAHQHLTDEEIEHTIDAVRTYYEV